jgi:dTDP-4-dehydrorhamnose reductase
MDQLRVLITGANGLLGQALIDRLYGTETYELLATSRDTHSYHPSEPRHKTLDITDHPQVEEVLDTYAPDVLVNCAAMTQVDACETRQEACWKVNASAVGHLTEVCHERDIHLVHLSTDFIFDGAEGPYGEDDAPAPVNYYGAAKLAGERAIQDSPLERWTIARTVLVYGTAERLKRSNIALWVIDELSNGRSVSIVNDQWRTPTYVPDLAGGIQRIIDREAFGVYHLSGPELVSVFEFARRIAGVFGFDEDLVQPTTSEALGQEARRPPKTGFVIDKAERKLGFQPHSIESALQDLGTALDLPTTA